MRKQLAVFQNVLVFLKEYLCVYVCVYDITYVP